MIEHTKPVWVNAFSPSQGELTKRQRMVSGLGGGEHFVS
jgi:hypothetical protein